MLNFRITNTVKQKIWLYGTGLGGKYGYINGLCNLQNVPQLQCQWPWYWYHFINSTSFPFLKSFYLLSFSVVPLYCHFTTIIYFQGWNVKSANTSVTETVSQKYRHLVAWHESCWTSLDECGMEVQMVSSFF